MNKLQQFVRMKLWRKRNEIQKKNTHNSNIIHDKHGRKREKSEANDRALKKKTESNNSHYEYLWLNVAIEILDQIAFTLYNAHKFFIFLFTWIKWMREHKRELWRIRCWHMIFYAELMSFIFCLLHQSPS